MSFKNIEYQNGMFVLSDPTDVTELVRSMRGKQLNEFVDETDPMPPVRNQNDILEEISSRLQSIEEKLQERERFLAQEFAAFTQKLLAALQQMLEYQETRRQEELVKLDRRLQEKLEAIQEFSVITEKLSTAFKQALEYHESRRQQELIERDRRLMEKLVAMLDKKAEGRNSSWWQKMFEAK